MTGKTLGVQNGSTGVTVLDEKPKLLKDKIKNHTPVLYDTFPNAFIDLNANRIQGILMDEVYANYYIKHQPNSNSYRTYISKELPMEHFAVGMRKGDKTLKKKINQGLGNLQKTVNYGSLMKNGSVKIVTTWDQITLNKKSRDLENSLCPLLFPTNKLIKI